MENEQTTQVQQPIVPVREYFTKEIMEQMNEMSIKEMFSVLKDLVGTRAWIAILKYNQQRLSISQNALFSGDPVKDPTNMARNQGIMLGLSDMQNAVISLISASNQVEEGSQE